MARKSKLTLASEWESQPMDWLIPGFLCASQTLISGEPKMGKSLLAGQIVTSLVHQEPFLGQQPLTGFHRVVWIGYDPRWAEEFKSNFPSVCNFVYFAQGAPWHKAEEWEQIGEEALEKRVTLIVVDHLYGVADTLDLDESHEMHKALSPLVRLREKTKLPMVLICQASKGGTGRSAHSNALDANFRHLIRITGDVRSSRRTLTTVGNQGPSFSVKIDLKPNAIQLNMEEASRREDRERQRTTEALKQSKMLLEQAPDWARRNMTQAGNWFAEIGISSTQGAGRSLANKLREMELIHYSVDSGCGITKGLKFST
jgi:hypothetical protein